MEFETEHITYTGDGKNNLLIVLLSALAEMESQQKSEAIKEMCIRDRMYVNMGGTAIGTCINADESYVSAIVSNLSAVAGLDLRQAKNLIDSTQNLDCFVTASSTMKTCAVNLSKISNDLRMMSSGPRTGFHEINLPPKQNGSSIMPGKVNPVIPEVMSQVAFNIIGNDVTVTTVSYTHLDVYKRQALCQPKRLEIQGQTGPRPGCLSV